MDLLKKEKLYKEKFIDRVGWLDRISFSRLEQIKQEAKTEDRSLYLTVEMPSVHHSDDTIAYSIVFYASTAEDEAIATSEAAAAGVADPELNMENLCEAKHHLMTRNARANEIDRRIQPNASARSALDSIIMAPSSQPLSTEERDLIWKFRFWLKCNPHALTKFIRSTNWDEELEVKEAIQAIIEWEPISACDALELLAPSFTHPFIRRYAVSRLQQTTYANIILYLPQLVQALRYETTANDMLYVEMTAAASMSTLVGGNEDSTDGDSKRHSTPTAPTPTTPTAIVKSSLGTGSSSAEDDPNSNSYMAEYFGSHTDLAAFLIHAACENSVIANFLYWYLKVEVESNVEVDGGVSQLFASMIERLKTALAKGNNISRQALATIHSQKRFVDVLVEMAKMVQEVGGSRAKKLEILRKRLAESTDLMDLKGLALPLDPSIHVRAINADSTMLFSSNLMPMRLTFSTVRGSATPFECGEAYTTIFKRGDDLRQDQLIIQMIRLMDSLLKEEKLDMCLTPYSVLATSVNEGFVKYVKATPIADIKGIQETLRTYRPSSSGPYGIEAEVMNNYVRSCAGYSIICYLLGIGDRHLHNVLLCENGKMFHVDFGFILGRDPKPMPPPMKLTSDIINAMGGQSSAHFKYFVDYCTTAFCILRRHANLITNLFSLMLDAGIPDIAVEKDKAVQKVLERFHLQLSDDLACQLINRLIETSLTAKMPILVDWVHDVKQFIST